MPSGGERVGRPGTLYPQRSDLAGKRTYGDGKTAEAVRTATPNSVTPLRPAQPGGGPPPPGSLTPLSAPSGRPDEPVTAGLDIGAGPGSEALTARPVQNDELFDLRALAAANPQYRSLYRIIAMAEEDA